MLPHYINQLVGQDYIKYLIALGKRKLSISSPFLAISANLSYDPIQFSYTKIDQAYISGFYFFISMPNQCNRPYHKHSRCPIFVKKKKKKKKLRTPLPRGSSLCEGMGEGCCTQPYPCICKEAVSGFEPMTNRSPRHNNFTAAPGLAPIFVKSNKNWRLQDNNSFDVHPFTQ